MLTHPSTNMDIEQTIIRLESSIRSSRLLRTESVIVGISDALEILEHFKTCSTKYIQFEPTTTKPVINTVKFYTDETLRDVTI